MRRPRPRRARTPRPDAIARVLCAAQFGLWALLLSACGDTLQDQPIPHNTLEGLLTADYPVYWLGRSFQGLAITEASHDPGGAFSIQYGDCTRGGQGTCVPPLRVISAPDTSFVPGGSAPHRKVRIRGIAAVAAEAGATIEIPTAGVVVGIYALTKRLAERAAETIVPINGVGTPGSRLPPPLPGTGFAQTPLPGQTPSALRPLHR